MKITKQQESLYTLNYNLNQCIHSIELLNPDQNPSYSNDKYLYVVIVNYSIIHLFNLLDEWDHFFPNPEFRRKANAIIKEIKHFSDIGTIRNKIVAHNRTKGALKVNILLSESQMEFNAPHHIIDLLFIHKLLLILQKLLHKVFKQDFYLLRLYAESITNTKNTRQRFKTIEEAGDSIMKVAMKINDAFGVQPQSVQANT